MEIFEDIDGLNFNKDEDRDHPPEYYLNQEDKFDKSEYLAEDYSDGSYLLLDYIEARFNQYCKYIYKDPEQLIRGIILRFINTFFD